MEILKTKNLSFCYPNASYKALNNVDFKINKGEFVVVTGKTGGGKSTLLKLIQGDIAPFGNLSGDIIRSFKQSGFVVQNPDTSFVAENVRGELAFALENMNLSNDSIGVKIGETASFFNLADMLDCKLCELSGGERATVAIAAAMINDADLLILDEPLAQLDPKATFQIISLLRRVNNELGVTVLMTSHTVEGICDFCDRVIVIENGQVAFNGLPSELVNTDAIDYFPVYTKLFNEHPLSVRDALPLAKGLKQKDTQTKMFSDDIVKLKNITFAYQRYDRDVLSSLNLTVKKGCVHSIIGSNGSGKTTLLKIIASIKKPYSGKVKVLGKVAYLPQDPRYLFTKEKVCDEITDSVAERFQLSEFMQRHPYDLSGGQMQKLALAILSQSDFDLLLLDEPSKALDVFARKDLENYIKSLSSQGKTVVTVSHDLDFVGDISDYVSFLADGIIAATGYRRNVLSSLNYYTTQIRRITRSTLESAVSTEDLI